MSKEFLVYTHDKFTFRVDPECLYHDSEFWSREEEGLITVGATDFMQTNAGDVAFLELPETGSLVAAGDEAGVIETIKTTVKIIAPVSGEIVMVNLALEDDPGLINTDAYHEGWIMKIKPSTWESEKTGLMNAEQYFPIMQEKIQRTLDEQ